MAAENRPTEAIVVATGVGQTNANLVPSEVISLQGQTASQSAGLTKVQSVNRKPLRMQVRGRGWGRPSRAAPLLHRYPPLCALNDT